MRTARFGLMGWGALLGIVSGCKDLTGNPGLPAGTPNPNFYNTVSAAVGMRNAAIFETEYAIRQYIIDSGLLTDELEDTQTGASGGILLQNAGQVTDPLDERILPAGVDVESYHTLQAVRTYSQQALGALAKYDTVTTGVDSLKVLRGELYTIDGYAEILLADLFCSGVPLSYLVYQGDYTYQPSSTTQQVYYDALAKFDSARALASTSDSVLRLTAVLQGRAYLDLGNYPAAADDVTNVPDSFQYQLALSWSTQGCNNSNGSTDELNCYGTVSDREGVNGLPFLSSHDPRTMVDTIVQPGSSSSGPFIPLTFPVKYSAALSGSGYAPFTVASGTEARLITAEVALHNGDPTTWLADLNALRTAAGLSTIADPVDPAARIDTMFTERAYWFFLDGHRQGDLRRLLREYGTQYVTFRSQEHVYPTGTYFAPGTGVYGTAVTAPIPSTEDANPNFHGCLNDTP